MICYLCKMNFYDLNILMKHLKNVHRLKTNSEYRCSEIDCGQIFDYSSNFKRHCRRKHPNPDNNSSISNPKHPAISNQTEPEISLETDSIQNNIPLLNSESSSSTGNKNELNMNKFISGPLKFVLECHNKNNFTRKDVLDMQCLIKENITKVVHDSLQDLAYKYEGLRQSSEYMQLLNFCKNPFDPFKTEYKLLKWLEENNLIGALKVFCIDSVITGIFSNGNLIFDEKKTTGVILPLKFQFQKFLEKNNNFNKMQHALEYFKNQKEKTFENFVQGSLWEKKTEKFKNQIVFPYFLYTDDFEINNPLGSHAGSHSINAFYYSFPLIQDNWSLHNIHVACLVKSIDIKVHGNSKCLQSLIHEIIELEEEGVLINTDTGVKRV